MGDEYEPAEVLILCQKNSVVFLGRFHNFPIDGSVLHLAYSQNVVAIRAERSHDGEVTTLVCEKRIAWN